MEADVEFTREFGAWWGDLSAEEQNSVRDHIALLRRQGPTLAFPYSSSVAGSCHSNFRELRIRHAGHSYRVLYGLDPHQPGILLVAGSKTPDDRWYERFVSIIGKLTEDDTTRFRELEAALGPDRIASSDIRAERMIVEMPLSRLRAARELSKEHLGKLLKKDESEVLRMESGADMYVTTLADFVKAQGGVLEIRASFPEGTVRISGLTED